MLNSLLVLGFLFLSLSVQAEVCFVVSGLAKDKNGAFEGRTLLNPQQSKINGKMCTVVGSLAELNVAIKKAEEKKILSLNSQLLIVMGAHGNKKSESGKISYDFNNDVGGASLEKVYGTLRSLAGKYQVGAVMDACHSGEVMQRLITEENDPLANKLCLVTSSSVGRESWGTDDDLLSLLGASNNFKNLEDLYLASPSGMISSAGWEETKIAKYYRQKDLNQAAELGWEILQGMDRLVRADGKCNTLAKANSALCTAPNVDSKLYKDIRFIMSPPAINKEKLAVMGIELSVMKSIKPMGKADVKAIETHNKCYDGMIKFYKRNIEWVHVEYLLEKVKKYETNIKDKTYVKTEEDMIRENCGQAMAGNPDFFLGGLKSDYEAYKKTQAETKARLKQSYKTTNWDDFKLNEFAQKSSGDKTRTCTWKDKTEIIQDMFGTSFFPDRNPAEPLSTDQLHTQLVWTEFQKHKLKDPKPYTNATDQKRRNACRDFKLTKAAK